MLKSLRRKFILTNMLLVGVLLMTVLVIFCLNTYSVQMHEIDKALQEPLRSEEYQEGSFEMMSSIVVLTDEMGNVNKVFTRGSSIDNASLIEAVNESLTDSERKGLLKKLKLFYERADIAGSGNIIVFVDASRFISVVQNNIFTSVIIFTVAMIAVFLISCFISKQAIDPIQESWDKQKRFIADASHELKTPITVILANSGILKDRQDSTVAEESQWIDSTCAEAEHMRKLVEDMLFLAKSDSSDLKPVKTKINLSELAEADILKFEPLAYEKGVKMTENIAKGVIVNGDPTQMKQLLHILLDNGIKYAEPQETENQDTKALIEVSLENGSHPKLSVRNTGEAMDESVLRHLFDRFYRADKSRTRAEYSDGALDFSDGDTGYGGGYGLGLAIAKTIAERHGAVISVRSDKSAGPMGTEGTEFKVIF